MSAKALQYAEVNLGVHEVWENVQAQLQTLDETLSELDKARDGKRKLDENMLDAEVDLINEKRGLHPNMSETAFKTNMKVWERESSELASIRVKLNDLEAEIQGLNYEVDILKLRIKAGSARLEELGGYLHYLAAVKNQAEKNTKRESE